MAEGMIMGRGGGAGLNYKIIMQEEAPALPTENTIWVVNNAKLTDYAIAPENPFCTRIRSDLVEDELAIAGVFGSDGVVSAQNTTNLEVYTEEYAMVDYGAVYAYNYKLSEAKAQWLAICEYKADKTFIKRTVLVNAVTGTLAAGTYTPSSENVCYVRFNWRTFGDSACSVEFYGDEAEFTKSDTKDGTLWIKTIEHCGVPLPVFKKNNLTVYLASAWVLKLPMEGASAVLGSWVKKNAFIYQGGEQLFIEAVKDLYTESDQCPRVTGGWMKTSGTLTFNSDHMHIKGSTGRVVTTYPIDTTGFKEILFYVKSPSASATSQVGIGTTQTAFVASAEVAKGVDGYEEVLVDVSDYQGMYYVQVYTTASTQGCYIRHVCLRG